MLPTPFYLQQFLSGQQNGAIYKNIFVNLLILWHTATWQFFSANLEKWWLKPGESSDEFKTRGQNIFGKKVQLSSNATPCHFEITISSFHNIWVIFSFKHPKIYNSYFIGKTASLNIKKSKFEYKEILSQMISNSYQNAWIYASQKATKAITCIIILKERTWWFCYIVSIEISSFLERSTH